eukprot:250367_1
MGTLFSPKSDRAEKQCANCDAYGATKRCSRCKQAYYCNSTCQRNNWKEHKRDCKSTNNANASTKNHNNKDRYTDNHQNECTIDVSHLEHQLNEFEKKRATIFGSYEKLQKEFTEFKDDTKQELKSIVSCTGNVLKCCHLQRLLLVMNKYHMNDHKILNDAIFDDILQILNDYLHLMQQHDDDEQFEYTVNQFIECDINNCTSFRRNMRIINNVEDISINRKILDKIHCFYQHCYDIGNKLLIKEQQQIKSLLRTEYNEVCYYIINQQIKQVNQILSTKTKSLTNIEGLNNRLKHKFNQLNGEAHQSINKDVVRKMYAFGTEFVYGYDDEIVSNYDAYTPIHPKYCSLKEELISNDIYTINIEQFNNEYQKAEKHLCSYHCKEYYKHISIQHLLSLMMYCNFDTLQQEFSATYRKKTTIHNNFYYMGKFVKMSVHQFGTKIKNGTIKTFYHGIGEKLLFPQIIGTDGRGISIYCPLSTSSSFAVAANFTNRNNGLIIEFCSNNSDAKYFSVAWISDYGNE